MGVEGALLELKMGRMGLMGGIGYLSEQKKKWRYLKKQ